uniref:NADH dehydrogenase [ubiquinone] 1 beta subcomplex subunit 9 n=1 Tax=Timspurckia oligopyrenoides TaxID=708627 RepID=A0A7S0ZDN1_9RHOD|mmetsp:Transcript_13743/g.24657  ORF Transcript_13743/g.24657 Transcript_13743/m.24657 type:complete len:123 (+) Transcript_13743:77-445(+)
MGTTASMPACRAAPFEKGISHRHQVMRLYRHTLRTSRDWHWDYFVWIEDCQHWQKKFKENVHLSVAEGRILVQKGLDELLAKRHPEPIIPIYRPGGVKYQRNTPPPPEVTEHLMPPPHQRIH